MSQICLKCHNALNQTMKDTSFHCSACLAGSAVSNPRFDNTCNICDRDLGPPNFVPDMASFLGCMRCLYDHCDDPEFVAKFKHIYQIDLDVELSANIWDVKRSPFYGEKEKRLQDQIKAEEKQQKRKDKKNLKAMAHRYDQKTLISMIEKIYAKS